MPNYVQKFASADVITQADFNTRTEDIENYVNGGIEGLDIDKTKWLDTKHVRSPAFYGSPAPRGEFVSGDVHYRRGARNEDQFLMWDTISTKFEPIFGLASTIHVTRHESIPSTFAYAHIHANFFVAEINNGSSGLSGVDDFETFEAAEFKLYVDGHAQPGTTRKVYVSTTEEVVQARKNICISSMKSLSPGVHDVYVAVRMISYKSSDTVFRAHIGIRSLVCDVYYL